MKSFSRTVTFILLLVALGASVGATVCLILSAISPGNAVILLGVSVCCLSIAMLVRRRAAARKKSLREAERTNEQKETL